MAKRGQSAASLFDINLTPESVVPVLVLIATMIVAAPAGAGADVQRASQLQRRRRRGISYCRGYPRTLRSSLRNDVTRRKRGQWHSFQAKPG